MKISFIRLVVIVVVITSHLPAQDAGLPRERIEALEKAITMEMSRQSIPGLSVMIATENQIREILGLQIQVTKFQAAGFVPRS